MQCIVHVSTVRAVLIGSRSGAVTQGFIRLLFISEHILLVVTNTSFWYLGVSVFPCGKTLGYPIESIFFFLILFIYLFIYGRVGSSFLCEGVLQVRQAGATLHRGTRASHYRGLSCHGAQAPDAQAQQLWLTGLVAPQHVGSSQTRAWTHVPCIGRQTLNHCATREAPRVYFDTDSRGLKKNPILCSYKLLILTLQ